MKVYIQTNKATTNIFGPNTQPRKTTRYTNKLKLAWGGGKRKKSRNCFFFFLTKWKNCLFLHKKIVITLFFFLLFTQQPNIHDLDFDKVEIYFRLSTSGFQFQLRLNPYLTFWKHFKNWDENWSQRSHEQT